MSRKQFLPYEYSNHITLNIDDIKLNGQNRSELIDKEARIIGLYSEEFSGDVTLEIKAEIDEKCLSLVPNEEREEPKWIAIVKLSCESTKYRSGYYLSQNGDKLTWSGSLSFETKYFDKNAKIQLYLVRSEPTNANNGFAKFAKTRIGESKAWSIEFDHPSTPKGQYLDIKWEPFSEHDLLRRHRDSVYYLDLHSSPPVLYLNHDVEQLPELLNSTVKSGARAEMRDQYIDSIVINIWTALFVKSAESCLEGEEPEEEWQQVVLKSISQMFYRELNSEDAYQRMLAEINEKRNISAFFSDLLPNLQNLKPAKVNLKESFEKLIKRLLK